MKIRIKNGGSLKVGSVHEIVDPPADRDPGETWAKVDCGRPVRLLSYEWEEVDDE